ncbi:hypothetical protein [Paractinoplanes rishiriensis]|uniref:Uncharacterized protein n=1 Tax=Paractinoplanes rishiriensis TaxID=1050105 RepID=A0A919N021_9ACTN|nr:hypothetical protein [Actinoplanes rishiriensis]GIF01995.1 hypothetical protein Ari01nite_94590 [Actinoplanes rishiriensis]
MSTAHPTDSADTNLNRPIRHVLSDESITDILTVIREATSTSQLLEDTIRALYRAILAGNPAAASSAIRPDNYALPATQWQAIISAAIGRAEQWGTQAVVVLDLAMNLMPRRYDDPTVPEPHMPLPDYRPAVRTIEWASDAIDVVTAVSAHLDQLRAVYGPASLQFLDAADSWQRALTAIITMNLGATATVSKDGPMSLLVRTGSGLIYAATFHADVRRCTVAGCGAHLRDDGTIPASHADHPVPEHQHIASYPLDGPRPGTWSLHS